MPGWILTLDLSNILVKWKRVSGKYETMGLNEW